MKKTYIFNQPNKPKISTSILSKIKYFNLLKIYKKIKNIPPLIINNKKMLSSTDSILSDDIATNNISFKEKLTFMVFGSGSVIAWNTVLTSFNFFDN